MPLEYPEWARWYKKPSYVDVSQFATAISNKAGTATSPNTPSTTPRASLELKRRSSTDIPRKLRLERILKNQTCMQRLTSMGSSLTPNRQPDVVV